MSVNAPQNMMWEVQEAFDDEMQTGYDDPNDPAADLNCPALSLDDQIKAYEAMQAAQARHQHAQKISPLAERAKVYFAEEALLYSNDRLLEEVKLLWYSRDELAVFKNERKQIVKVLKKTNFDLVAVEESGQFCLRGYEAYFSMEVNKAMKYARTLVTSLVMDEQDRQRALGYLDDECMRLSCTDASQWARDNALQLGRNDEYEAYGDYDECCSMGDPSNNSCFDELDLYPTTDASEYNSEAVASIYSSDDLIPQSLVHGNDSLAQPEQNAQPRTTGEEADVKDQLAERLDSALKLVQALRFGTSSAPSSQSSS